MSKLYSLIVGLAGLVALALGVYLYKGYSTPDYSNNTFIYQPTRQLESFNLIDDEGQQFSNEDLLGKWSFVFLGYISCPDVCPMTMSKFSRAIPQIEAAIKQPTQVLFLSVDPKRDTQTQIAEYTNYFHQNIIGLYGDHSRIFPFVRNLGLMYSIPDEAEQEGYYVDHSASIVLVNPQGHIAAIFKPEIVKGQVPTVNMTHLVHDFERLAKS